jgi:hypothetical protein
VRVGPLCGPLIGGAFGGNYDVASDPLATVSRDATSGIYTPASAAEWTKVLTAAAIASGGPGSTWLCQEASGNLADSIGSVTLTANGAVTYRGGVGGWTRLAAGIPAATAARFQAAAGIGPNPASTSVLWLGYILAAVTANNRGIMTIGGAAAGTNCEAFTLITTHFPRLTCVAVTADGASDPTAAVRPWIIRYDRTNSRVNLYTNQEKVTGTYNAGVTDGNKGFGATANAAVACTASLLYGACFSGAAAELTDAQIKKLLQTLGWTIPWS